MRCVLPESPPPQLLPQANGSSHGQKRATTGDDLPQNSRRRPRRAETRERDKKLAIDKEVY